MCLSECLSQMRKTATIYTDAKNVYVQCAQCDHRNVKVTFCIVYHVWLSNLNSSFDSHIEFDSGGYKQNRTRKEKSDSLRFVDRLHGILGHVNRLWMDLWRSIQVNTKNIPEHTINLLM